jgi:hypothetical protein
MYQVTTRNLTTPLTTLLATHKHTIMTCLCIQSTQQQEVNNSVKSKEIRKRYMHEFNNSLVCVGFHYHSQSIT